MTNRWPRISPRFALAAATLSALLMPSSLLSADPPGQESVALFNGKDLSNWTVFVDPSTARYSPDSKAEGIFQVRDGQIAVSGERFACLTTKEEYENYRLIVEFRWGEKKWPPRETQKRDSGILMHAVGPDKIWTKSIECQIQEGDCGDFFMVGGTGLTVGGKAQTGGRFIKTKDAEKPNGEWNTIEVVCDGGKIANIVNGVVVNEGTDASLTKGRIVLQSEGAEVYFRKVEIRPLKK